MITGPIKWSVRSFWIPVRIWSLMAWESAASLRSRMHWMPGLRSKILHLSKEPSLRQRIVISFTMQSNFRTMMRSKRIKDSLHQAFIHNTAIRIRFPESVCSNRTAGQLLLFRIRLQSHLVRTRWMRSMRYLIWEITIRLMKLPAVYRRFVRLNSHWSVIVDALADAASVH